MANDAELSQVLSESLVLDLPPIALRFVTEAPANIRMFEGEVPSACTFWRRAEGGTFFATAAGHLNCLIGAHTMGMPLEPAQSGALMDLIGQMQAAGYLDADEVQSIPTVAGQKAGIVYGPLAESSGEYDVVLVWVTPRQSMLLQEATGNVAWLPQSGIRTFGRPSCAAIPAALDKGTATLSLGCAGMRTFTEIPDDRMLAVLPRAILDGLAAGLKRVVHANETMLSRYEALKAAHSG